MTRRRLINPQLSLLSTLLILASAAGAVQARQSGDPAADTSSLSDSVRQMQLQIQQLQTMVQGMKEDADRNHLETLQLRRELELTRARLDAVTGSTGAARVQAVAEAETVTPQDSTSSGATITADGPGIPERITKLEEDEQLLNDKVEEQYQTKVESASKHRVKLSGILLMNLFSNTGNVDHMEVPAVALPTTISPTSGNTGGSFGGSFRQSELGLEVIGPTLAGAKTEANFVADFFGEFPETNNGSPAGQLRLRTGDIHLNWEHTSLTAGMDSLFFSPIYPTSFAAVGIPPLSYSGNLWSWTPQVWITHDVASAGDSKFTISAGLLDPLTGEQPSDEWLRTPGAGESSRQPGYAARLEWHRKVFGQPAVLGIGGYYNRENWGFNRNINGWVATNDWIVPFGEHFSLSGKFYDGQAIGGLGAGIGRSVVFNGILSEPAATVSAVGAIGGWSQLKFKANSKLEFNVAAGQDTGAAGDVRGFPSAPGDFAANLTRNRSEFANFIYRPRSNLLFSTEFRTIRTYAVDAGSERANQLNLIMGVLF